MSSFKESLKAARRKTAHGFYFVPEGHLSKLFTGGDIRQELSRCAVPPEMLEDTLQLVTTKARKLFATLVRSDQQSLIMYCIENEIFDDRLPLDNPIPDLNLNEKFYNIQWEFLAPVFSKRSVVLKLKDDHIMPFLEDSKIDNAHGGFADAFRVALDPNHQALEATAANSQDGQINVFRKEIIPVGDDDAYLDIKFQEEDRILKLLNTLKHENIVQLYLSYRHRGKYSFLFPLAEGDLWNLLRSPHRPAAFETDTSIIKALHGLASALVAVHDFDSGSLSLRFKGCHHDIKPQNILISQNKFLLADFGLSRFKQQEENSTSMSKSIGEYLAPECRGTENQRQLIGRKSDIWSLGCIMFELLVYMDSGSTGVDRCRSTRMTVVDQWTSYAFHLSGHLKTSVDQHLAQWSATDSMENYRLLSQLIRNMLQQDPSRRPDAAVVRKSLCCLQAKFLVDDWARLFRVLIGRYQDASLAIEGERLRSWAYTVGVYQSRHSWSWSECQVNLLVSPVLDTLHCMFDVLSHLCTHNQELDDPSSTSLCPPGATIDDTGDIAMDCDRLRIFNDQLVSFLDPANKKSLRRYLFRRIPQTEEKAEFQGKVAELQPLAQLKLSFQLAQEKELSGELKYKIPESAKVSVIGSMEHHSIAKYVSAPELEEEEVLVEWRPMNSPERPVTDELLSRVDTLAGLASEGSKPAEIRVLDCLGYYLDEERRAFGVVYQYPQHGSGRDKKTLEPISLHERILSTAHGNRGRPYLGTRFAVARTIVSCIFYCHGVNWLHERLNSFNVIFFAPSEAIGVFAQTMPYVVGFDHSRQDIDHAFSHGPPAHERFQHYLHPQYVKGSNFKRLYDYYSVGLVLLEIGLWRTLESMTATYQFHNREGIRKEIVERYLPDLLHSMGEIYYRAVRACVDDSLGDIDTADDVVAENFQVMVVDKLDKCVV